MHMPDSEIVTSIVTGDPDGLAAAYDRYADALYKYCRAMLGDPDAADAVQATFLIAASRLAGLDDPRRLRAWLYAIARNECVRVLRSRAIMPAPWETPGGADLVIDITEGAAERARLRALLMTAVHGLGPDEREALELLLRQGLEPGEMAAVLGVSIDRAHVLAAQAHDQLEACIAVLLLGGARGGVRGSARGGAWGAGVLGGGCGELAVLLADWDGQLTVALRKRVHPHIERCPTCGTRFALYVGPAVLLGMPAGAAMAAAAAESFLLAPGAPGGLREHTLSLAADQDPGAIAYRFAAASRAGTFGPDGFPEPLRRPRAKAGLRSAASAQAAMTGLRSTTVALRSTMTGLGSTMTGLGSTRTGLGSTRTGLRSTPRERVAVAVVAVIAVAATAFALSRGTGSGALAGPKLTAPAAPTKAAPTKAAPTKAAPTKAAPTAQPTREATTPARPPATTQPPVPAAPVPAPAPRGTLSVSLGDGPVQAGTPLTLSQGDGTPITLTANGGPVTWSVSVSGGPPGHQVAVSGPSSGTLQPGQSAQIVLTAAKAIHGATLTVNPGGAAYPLTAGSQNQ